MSQNPKHIARNVAGKQPTKEEQAAAVYRSFAQRYNQYFEAALFNALGNADLTSRMDRAQLYEFAGQVAEEVIGSGNARTEAAFQRWVETLEKDHAEKEVQQ